MVLCFTVLLEEQKIYYMVMLSADLQLDFPDYDSLLEFLVVGFSRPVKLVINNFYCSATNGKLWDTIWSFFLTSHLFPRFKSAKVGKEATMSLENLGQYSNT